MSLINEWSYPRTTKVHLQLLPRACRTGKILSCSWYNVEIYMIFKFICTYVCRRNRVVLLTQLGHQNC